MSGICGLFRRDGRPVAPEEINRMVAAMAWLGPDGTSIWREGPVGFGHLLLKNTPESLYEQHPIRSRDGNLTLVATTRLDNREELLRAFGVPRSEWGERTDPWLCLRAYEKWGENAAEHILGDWAFALWDRRESKLFLTRDQHGSPGLFYFASESLFAFASSTQGLRALPDVPSEFDDSVLVRKLVWRLQSDRTIWRGIRELHGSNQIAVAHEQLRKTRYHHLENAPEVRLGSDEEYLEAFRELFTESIRCRLRHLRPPCVSLSGGLDSASIAVVAAGLLKDQRLRSFTSVPAHSVGGLLPLGRHADETPFVEALRRQTPNLDVTYLRNEGESPLKACLRASRLIDSPKAVANYLWILDIRERAAREGLGVVLSGFGGNATISWYGHGSVYDNGDWRRPIQVARQLDRWRKEMGLSLLRAIRSQLIGPLIPRELKHHLNLWRYGAPVSATDGLVNPDLVRELKLEAWLRSELGRPAWTARSDTRAGRCDVLHPGGYSAPSRALIDSGFGLETRDPALDLRIIEFCLGIPDRLYARGTENRLIIRRTMRGLLPEIILKSRTRELQSCDIGFRLRATLGELQDTFRRVETSPACLHYLNVSKMRAILQRLASNSSLDAATNRTAGMILLRGLVAGEFLRTALEGDPPAPGRPL